MTERNEELDDNKSHVEVKETEAEINEVQIPTQPEAVQPPANVADQEVSESIEQQAKVTEDVASNEVEIDAATNETDEETNATQEHTPAINVSREQLAAIVDRYESKKREIEIFARGVQSLLMDHPDLYRDGKCIVHSSKFRLKDPDHLKEKVLRKSAEGKEITEDNLFETVTDLSGVRILHLFQEDFRYVDALVRRKVQEGDWFLFESPVANTWDPEAKKFFSNFELNVRQTETLYTSVHYLIKPREDSSYCCEVQVRTLFEEVWGEVDHQINYPQPTDSVSLREQLLVLSKITGAGSRLLDAIRRVTDANNS